MHSRKYSLCMFVVLKFAWFLTPNKLLKTVKDMNFKCRSCLKFLICSVYVKLLIAIVNRKLSLYLRIDRNVDIGCSIAICNGSIIIQDVESGSAKQSGRISSHSSHNRWCISEDEGSERRHEKRDRSYRESEEVISNSPGWCASWTVHRQPSGQRRERKVSRLSDSGDLRKIKKNVLQWKIFIGNRLSKLLNQFEWQQAENPLILRIARSILLLRCPCASCQLTQYWSSEIICLLAIVVQIKTIIK